MGNSVGAERFALRQGGFDAHEVAPGLWVGRFPTEADVAELRQRGIQAVLSVVDDRDPAAVCPAVRQAFAWAQVPVLDALYGGVPTIEDVADAVGVLRTWRASGIEQIYVHCWLGHGRSPLMAMAFLVHGFDGQAKMRLTKAIAQVATARPVADPNAGQLRVLADYVYRALHEDALRPEHYRISARVRRHEPRIEVEIRDRGDASRGLAPGNFRELRDRYRGALIGLATGDVLGVPLEFKPPGTFKPVSEVVGGGPFGLEPGEWTDDTSMALCLAESLILKGGHDPIDQLERYVRWWRKGHLSSKGSCFDIGNTVAESLAAFERTRSADVGASHERAAGNGSIMRLAPAPLYFAHEGAAAREAAAASSRPTHANQVAVDACVYFGHLLRQAVLGASKEALCAPWQPPTGELAPAIAAIAQGSFKTKRPPEIRGGGWVMASLEAALWAFWHGADFEEGCKLAVNLGDDAGTTGAVFGQLAGAHYGEAAIPARWREKLVDAHRIGRFAEGVLLGALSHVVEAPKVPFLRPLAEDRLIASDDPRFAAALQADFGPGMFLDVERLLALPATAQFDVTPAIEAEPARGNTYIFVPVVDEDDL